MRLSKNVKRVIKAILFVAIFALLMMIFDASFEMDESATEGMLTKYSRTDNIDMIFVGNSAGEMVDDTMYSSLSGKTAFNMCTPSQGLSVSSKNIELAASHHDIKDVVLLMTFDVMDSENYNGIDHLYDRTVDSSSPFWTRVKNSVKRDFARSMSYDVINTEKSINVWIPWENETMHGFENVRNNITKRCSRFVNGGRLGSNIAFDLNTKKYDRQPGELTDEDKAMLDDDILRISETAVPEDLLAVDKVRLLENICIFCRDNDIRLRVIVTPHRTDYFDRYEGYRHDAEELSAYLRDFLSKRGVMYYNTEDDPEVHEMLLDAYFYDWEHVSEPYKGQATEYLVTVLERLEE